MSFRRVFSAAVSLGLLSAWTMPLRAAEENLQVDTVHSSVIYKVKHLGVSYFYGRFNDISGTVRLDPDNPAKNAVELTVKAESIDTANTRRDQHLKGPDFFDAKQFSLITFKSKEVKKTGDSVYEVAGDLSLHGVTKEIRIKVELTGTGPGQRGERRTGFETAFKIKRSDHGMNFMIGPLSDEVEILIGLACVARPAGDK